MNSRILPLVFFVFAILGSSQTSAEDEHQKFAVSWSVNQKLLSFKSAYLDAQDGFSFVHFSNFENFKKSKIKIGEVRLVLMIPATIKRGETISLLKLDTNKSLMNCYKNKQSAGAFIIDNRNSKVDVEFKGLAAYTVLAGSVRIRKCKLKREIVGSFSMLARNGSIAGTMDIVQKIRIR